MKVFLKIIKNILIFTDVLVASIADDESREDEDGIRKLLHSSLSPRHSPMPFHHHLRQSIRSSMLKEVSGIG